MQNLRKLIASLGVVAIISTLVVSTAVAGSYTDVPEDHWAYSYVEDLAALGVFDAEKDTFNPGVPMTRAEFVKTVVEAAGLEGTTEIDFPDVSDEDAWYYDYVATGVANGIIGGYEDGTFGPMDSLTREQAAKIAVLGFDMEEMLPEEPSFPDVAEDRWSYGYVETLVAYGVVNGYEDGTFGPEDQVLREQVAKIVGISMDAEAPTPGDDDDDDDDTPPVSDGDLYVEIADDTPVGDNVPRGVIFPVASWDLTSDGDDVKVTGLTVTHGGVGSSDEVISLVLKDADGNRVSKVRTSINSEQQTTFSFLSGGMTVEDGDTETVYLYVQSADAANAGIHNFAIEEAEDVVTNGTVDGDFPAEGDDFAFINVSAGAVTISSDGTPAGVKLGEEEVELSKIKLAAGSTEDLELFHLTLRDNGTANLDQAVENVALMYGGDIVADGVVNDDYVSFNIEEGVDIGKGKTEKFQVVGDMVGEAGRTIELYLENDLDLEAVGQLYGYAVDVTNSLATTDVTPITIEAGAISIVKVDPATSTQKDKDNVVFGTVEITVNAGQDLEMEAFNATLATTTTNVEDLLENIELYDVNNGTVYDLTVANGNSTSATIYERDLGLMLENGETYKFAVRADTLNDALVNTDNFQLSLSDIGDGTNTDGIEFKETDDNQYVSDVTPSSITFKQVKGQASAISLTTKPLADKNVVVGATESLALEFSLEETAGVSDITLKELKVADVAANLDSAHVAQLKLYSVSGDTETLLKTKSGSQAASDIITFNNLDTVITESTKTTFRVRADFVNDSIGLNGDDFNLRVSGLDLEDLDNDDVYVSQDDGTGVGATATDGVLAATENASTSRTITLAGTGILYTSVDNIDAATDQEKWLLAGSTSDFVASFEFRAENEDINVTDLTVIATEDVSGFELVADEIILYANDKTTEIARKAVTSDVTVFQNIDYVVGETSQNMYVKLVLNPYGKNQIGVLDEDSMTLALEVQDENDAPSAEGVSSGNLLTEGDDDSTEESGEIVYEGDDDAAAITDASNAFGVVVTQFTEIGLVDSASGSSVVGNLTNGSNNVAIMKLVTAPTVNSLPSGGAVKTLLQSLTFDLVGNNGHAAGAGMGIFSAANVVTLKKVGSSNAAVAGVLDDYVDADALTYDGTATFDLTAAGFGTDDEITPGSTIYFLLNASVSNLDGVTTGLGYLQVNLDTLDASNVVYKDAATAANKTSLLLDYSQIDGTKINELN